MLCSPFGVCMKGAHGLRVRGDRRHVLPATLLGSLTCPVREVPGGPTHRVSPNVAADARKRYAPSPSAHGTDTTLRPSPAVAKVKFGIAAEGALNDPATRVSRARRRDRALVSEIAAGDGATRARARRCIRGTDAAANGCIGAH